MSSSIHYSSLSFSKWDSLSQACDFRRNTSCIPKMKAHTRDFVSFSVRKWRAWLVVFSSSKPAFVPLILSFFLCFFFLFCFQCRYRGGTCGHQRAVLVDLLQRYVDVESEFKLGTRVTLITFYCHGDVQANGICRQMGYA